MAHKRAEPTRRRGLGCGCLLVLGLILLAIVVSQLPDQDEGRPQRSSPVDGDARWKAALRGGNGVDWVELSDRDKMTLCVEAANALGKGDNVAWAYHQFLEEFYRRPTPETRSRTIAETLAVCQVMIDRGAIELE